MKKLLGIISIIFLFLQCLFATNKETLRLDASNEEKMQQSFFKILMSLDDSQQQKFASAMATIGVMLQQEDGARFGNLKDLINGKTADEIIATARRMTPYIKQHSKIIDGSSTDSMGKSISHILISLPEEKQPQFSEAIAKLMFEAKKNKEDESVLRKRLDGKTGEEVIELARKIDLPFSINQSSQKEYQIAPLSEQEKKQLNIPKQKPEPQKSYEESLVPKL